MADQPATKCPRCGDDHTLIACPHVKAIDFAFGTLDAIDRVEFLTPADYGTRTSRDDEIAQDYPRLRPSKSVGG